MSSSQVSALTTQSNQRFIRTVASRPYPAFARPFIHFAPEDVPPLDLAGQIEAAVRSRMMLTPSRGVYEDIQRLLDDYAQSIQVVRKSTADVRQMVEGLLRLNTPFHSVGEVNTKARDEFMTTLRRQLSEQVDTRLTPPSNLLSAALEAKPIAQVEIELRRSVDEAVRDLAAQFCDLLDRMVDHDLVGLVDWQTDTACDAYFYQHLTAQEQLSKELVAGNWRVVAVHDEDLIRAFEITREVFQVETGRHIQLHVMYWLYLTNAKANPIEDFHGIVPIGVQRFLASLPEWLRGFVRIVDGTRRHEQISALDVRVEEYVDAKVVKIHETEVCEYDPLVTLGHYVLTGWGKQEIGIESARQSSVNLSILAVLLLLLATGLFALGQLAHAAFGVAAAVVGGLGLVVFVAERGQRSIAKRRKLSLFRLGKAALWWAVLSLGLFGGTMGLVSRDWLLMVSGVSALVVVGAMWGLGKARERG